MQLLFSPLPKSHCSEGSQASPPCLSDKSSRNMKISKEHWWNDTDGTTEILGEKNPSQCRFVRHRFHVVLTGDQTRASVMKGWQLTA